MNGNQMFPRQFKKTEEDMVENIELKRSILELADAILPVLKGDAKVGDVNKMLERFAPAAALSLWNEMLNAKGEKTRLEAAKTLAFMAGYKPVEKTVAIEGNLDRMSEAQIDGFLQNALTQLTPKDRQKVIELVKVQSDPDTYALDLDNLKEEGV